MDSTLVFRLQYVVVNLCLFILVLAGHIWLNLFVLWNRVGQDIIEKDDANSRTTD